MAAKCGELKIINLFSGAGGFSLGARRAGFDIAGSVEIDPQAISVYERNFPNTSLWPQDLSIVSAIDILQTFNLKVGEIDGIIGGPPCQGFSHMGQNNSKDPRNKLFTNFFQIVKDASPKFFLAENVPGILSRKNKKFIKQIRSKLKDKYEILEPMSLVAKEFGVPTTRERVFFFGYLKDEINSIEPTEFEATNAKLVCVKDALKGLRRKIDPLWLTEEDGWKKIKKNVEGDFGSKLYGQIPDGVGDLESITRLEGKSEVSGCLGTRHSKKVLDRYSKIKPGEIDHISKSRRLNSKGFCPTLTAGTSSDKGSYQAVRPLHPTQNRVITPREAARLQGFPDWFQFHATKWHSFRQIGNSVSPILAEHILSVIKKAF
ncbi:MAG: DNA cytosine methyltransferase [Candidatus Poribacteria bacterium]|nr:DNA cytosine methyltransferase [Candidatus Poribacteria bacterium]